jgi:cytosine/adenosine deaminase-related metal-dependent hydrolase
MSFDDDDDALREMRLLWHSQKGSDLGGAIDRDDLFRAVFVSGRPTVTPIPGGAIKTDLAADLVLMDYQKMAWDRLGGVTDELDMVLTRARKEFVHSLIVAGRPVVSDGKVQTVSLADLERELLDQARQAWSQTAGNTPLRRRYQAALAEFYERENHIKDPDEP